MEFVRRFSLASSTTASRRGSSKTVSFGDHGPTDDDLPGVLTKIAKHLSCHPEYHVYDGEVYNLRRRGSGPSGFNHERYQRHHRASKSFASPPGYHNHPRRNSDSRPPEGFGMGTIFCIRRKSMVEYYRWVNLWLLCLFCLWVIVFFCLC